MKTLPGFTNRNVTVTNAISRDRELRSVTKLVKKQLGVPSV